MVYFPYEVNKIDVSGIVYSWADVEYIRNQYLLLIWEL